MARADLTTYQQQPEIMGRSEVVIQRFHAASDDLQLPRQQRKVYAAYQIWTLIILLQGSSDQMLLLMIDAASDPGYRNRLSGRHIMLGSIFC